VLLLLPEWALPLWQPMPVLPPASEVCLKTSGVPAGEAKPRILMASPCAKDRRSDGGTPPTATQVQLGDTAVGEENMDGWH
jgi:hypothetical protein